MGFFEGLDAEAYDRTYRDRDLIRRMAGYFRPYLTQLVMSVLALVIVSGAGAASPIVVARGVDLMASSGSPRATSTLVGLLFLLGLVVWGANWIRRRYTTRAVANVMLDLRREAFAASASHDLSFYDEFASGRIVSRITSDTQDFAQVVLLVTDLFSEILEGG
ncbi:MAG: ABC transporter transmembrane domain-containing protein, partial [Anaerolineales bacterium]|nr:ABC transporter transmembrane domain-containing protein [Anaerolineales bacterium]